MQEQIIVCGAPGYGGVDAGVRQYRGQFCEALCRVQAGTNQRVQVGKTRCLGWLSGSLGCQNGTRQFFAQPRAFGSFERARIGTPLDALRCLSRVVKILRWCRHLNAAQARPESQVHAPRLPWRCAVLGNFLEGVFCRLVIAMSGSTNGW